MVYLTPSTVGYLPSASASSNSSATYSSASSFTSPQAPRNDYLPLPTVADYRNGLSTPTASPVLSRSTAPSPVKLNPILINLGSSSRFDFSAPNAVTNTFPHEPAFTSAPVTNYIPILCGPFNVLIYIQHLSSQLNCLDFLRLISTALAQPVNPYTDQEWLQVGPQNQQLIMQAYNKRVRNRPDPYVRKIDFLLSQTRLDGFKPSYNAWTLLTA
ncbi:hypothetical protein Clacol_010594 [Clathrus columnatus]|uniref:DUF6699 domain-containing protein n=1 Tax=Clathrus columnatus TaxID=1419009 RepID=A0AAV5AR33_9AGAM|nr:hypothetical protein Clacol_009018 [Clathrus columnatus]GJJ16297.1 hypothetical protein Clacol_010594 [Clathrus columnatus]